LEREKAEKNQRFFLMRNLGKKTLLKIQTNIENRINLVNSTVTSDYLLKNIMTPPKEPEKFDIADLYLKDYILY
jgi:hypothetical protein